MSRIGQVRDQYQRSSLYAGVVPAARPPAILIGLLLVGPLALALLRGIPALDRMLQSAAGHFWIVTTAAIISIGLVLLILRAALARQDGRVLLIGGAFLALSGIFLVHAISTPGMLFTSTVLATRWSTPLALLSGAIILALSTREGFAGRPWLVRWWWLWLGSGIALMLVYAHIMLAWVPTWTGNAAETTAHAADHAEALLPVAPALTVSELAFVSRSITTIEQLLPVISLLSIVLFGLSAWTYLKQWQLTPTRPLAALAISSVLLAETAIAAHFGVLWQLSFWLYHLLLISSILTVSYGIAIGYEQSGSLSRAVEGLLLGATLQRQRDAFQRGMVTLLDALEQGDAQALPALRGELRQRLGLAEDQITLLEHAVEVVAKEREEQQRLRAVVEVGRALTVELDQDHLLHNAMATFAEIVEPAICAVGLVDGSILVFQPQHRIVGGQPAPGPVAIPLSMVPDAWLAGDATPAMGRLSDAFAALLPGAGKQLIVPVHHRGRLIGVLAVQPRMAGKVDDGLVKICGVIAVDIAMALANARLFQDLQQKHADLVRSEEARDQLTQMVVHDLKNPLSAIRANLAILETTALTAEQQQIIAETSTSATLMLQLISDLLDIARLEEGRLELHRFPTSAPDLLHGCASELRPWAAQDEKQVEVAAGGDMPLLLIDTRLIRRVMTNLLSNAIKHTPSGTQITLGAEVAAAEVRLWVQDTGNGIAPEQQARLFERFQTGGSGDGMMQSNTGLGLTFCKLAVEAHGGTIGISSTPGEGATFTIRLPSDVVEREAPVESIVG